MIGNFNEETQKILVNAKLEMISLKHPYIGTEHLVLAILKSNTNLASKLKDYKLTYEKFKNEIIKIVGEGSKKSEYFLYTPLFKKVIENAVLDSKENNNGEVTIEHLFSSLLEEGEGIAIRIFIGMGLDVDDMYDEFSSKLIKKTNKKNKKLLLEDLGVNLTEKAKNNELDPVIDREASVQRLIEILCRRTKNNPILIGKAGVGKTAIVEELARLIQKDMVPINISGKKIISLDMASAVSGTKYRGEFEERMKKIIKELEENDDIILFIDEIHTLVGAGGAEGAIDASNILKPALARGKIRCIGATTYDEYKKYIEKDSALERRFQKITIEEPSIEETKDILLKLKPIYERYHKVKISNEIIDKIITLSEKYIYDRNRPDKCIDILDEVCSKVSIKEDSRTKDIKKLKDTLNKINKEKNSLIIENNIDKAYLCRKEETNIMNKLNELQLNYKKTNKEVTIEDIGTVINNKTKIPLYEILEDNITTIKVIENNLKKEIIGQDEAINKLIKITKKIKLGYKDNRCNSMLFVGSSGVGKTMLASIFANNLVGESNLIRLDMSEYSDATSINKIVGSSPGYVGYDDNKNVLEEIRNKPNAIILLDEIEKAHPLVINLLYQILDYGKIKDSKGNMIRFDNNIIIMTSNVGFEKNKVGFTDINNDNVLSNLKTEFSNSFINRIDEIIIFNNLTEEEINKIVKNKITKLKNKYKDKIKINVSNNTIKEIVNSSNYNVFGARRIDKILDKHIENIIIDAIIEKKLEITIKEIEKIVS